MPRFLPFLLIVVSVLLSCGAGTVDTQKAITFADSFMADVINDRRDDIYLKMEPEFHDLTPKDQFIKGWGGLSEVVGKPTASELASYGIGVRTITAGPHVGQTKPTCELIYKVSTTKGVYPFRVKVVNSEGGLAVTSATFELPN